jgi:hypothetical protein
MSTIDGTTDGYVRCPENYGQWRFGGGLSSSLTGLSIHHFSVAGCTKFKGIDLKQPAKELRSYQIS